MRKFAFDIYSKFLRKEIDQNLKEVRRINLGGMETIRQWQENKISSLLIYASQNTEFYRKYQNKENLDFFEVINKNLIKKHFEELHSPSVKGPLKKVSTSGSTGVPFITFHNPEKAVRNIADQLFFSGYCGHAYGDPLYYIRIWNELNALSFKERKLKNIIPVDTKSFTEESVRDFLHKLRKQKQKKSILSYSSSLEILKRIILMHKIEPDDFKLTAIFSMAEALSAQTKEFLEDFFQCPVYSRYSNTENGFIAHQLPGFQNNYLINNTGFKVEIFDVNKDEKLGYGESGRIVVTDLFNKAYPMIRYDTGDIGVMDLYKYGGKEYEVLSRIEGRLLDFINIDGNLISPHVVDYALRSFKDIKQFQIIQKTNDRFDLKLNVFPKSKMEAEDQVLKKLKEYLGEKALISIEYVEDIPLLSSGKRKIVVSEI